MWRATTAHSVAATACCSCRGGGAAAGRPTGFRSRGGLGGGEGWGLEVGPSVAREARTADPSAAERAAAAEQCRAGNKSGIVTRSRNVRRKPGVGTRNLTWSGKPELEPNPELTPGVLASVSTRRAQGLAGDPVWRRARAGGQRPHRRRGIPAALAGRCARAGGRAGSWGCRSGVRLKEQV